MQPARSQRSLAHLHRPHHSIRPVLCWPNNCHQCVLYAGEGAAMSEPEEPGTPPQAAPLPPAAECSANTAFSSPPGSPAASLAQPAPDQLDRADSTQPALEQPGTLPEAEQPGSSTADSQAESSAAAAPEAQRSPQECIQPASSTADDLHTEQQQQQQQQQQQHASMSTASSLDQQQPEDASTGQAPETTAAAAGQLQRLLQCQDAGMPERADSLILDTFDHG